MKLEQIITISGKIHCMTGLCIGGSSNGPETGGNGQEVIKNPLTKEPYIPGSSLKGKMRSELEKKYGSRRWNKESGKFVADEKEPCGCGRRNCMICVIFGAYKNIRALSAPTRIIVRDAMLSEESRAMLRALLSENGGCLERKVENIIRRDSEMADSPRTIERVPSGVSFDCEIILRAFEGDDPEKMAAFVKEGLKMVESSYLGGNGSRGSGKVRFEYAVVTEKAGGR